MHTRVANLTTAAACAGPLLALFLALTLALTTAGLPGESTAAYATARPEGAQAFGATVVDPAADASPYIGHAADEGMPPLAMVLVALGFIALGQRRWRAPTPAGRSRYPA